MFLHPCHAVGKWALPGAQGPLLAWAQEAEQADEVQHLVGQRLMDVRA